MGDKISVKGSAGEWGTVGAEGETWVRQGLIYQVYFA